jgi:uncharacterized protein (TIGR02268 family)
MFLQGGAPVAKSSFVTNCEDVERVELSRIHTEVAREICVSPGLMTGFLFDISASVEIEDEVRFVEVIRGRSGLSFVPPRDMAPGERLRLTMHLGEGESRQSATFMLVARRGQATRQVEVYHDRRTRGSYLQEVEQERAKSQRLRDENQRLLARIEQAGGLRSLFSDDESGIYGVQATTLRTPTLVLHSDDDLTMMRGIRYRAEKSVAAKLWLMNHGTEPWSATGASIVTAKGEKLKGIALVQAEAIAPHEVRPVFVEADATLQEARGDVTINLWDASARAISISKVAFPE